MASEAIPGLLRDGARYPKGDWEPPTPEELGVRLPHYEISELLGHGGMGAVYKGWQKSLARFVAIKILPPGHDGGDADFAARFKREGAALAQLRHPNIIPVHDAGEKPGGLLYFVMDFVEGTDLQQVLVSRGRLPVEEALGIAMQVLDALAYAHGCGVIHRDIKPGNIMVDDKGRVLVADFGLAKSTASGPTRITSSHVIIGTPDFMAPEAMKCAADVDHRADLYAVGVMLYEMLTGHLPRGRFESPTRAVPGLDRRIDRIVDRALQSDREARYSSAAEFHAAIGPVLARTTARRTAVDRPVQRTAAKRSVPARKIPPAARARSRRHPFLLGGLALLIAGAAWGAWKILHHGGPRAPGQPAATAAAGGGAGHNAAAHGAPVPGVPAWRDALAESPMKDFIGKVEHTDRGYLLPNGNHWRYPAEAVLSGAMHVRGSSEDGRMALHFHYDDGGAGGGARAYFKDGKCTLISHLRSNSPFTMLGESNDATLGDSPHDFLLTRIAGRFLVVLDGRTIIEVADPNPVSGRLSVESGAGGRLRAEKVEYVILDSIVEAEALTLLGLPAR